MNREIYDFRDVAEVVAAAARRVRLDAGSVHVVLVEDPSDRQEIAGIRRMRSPAHLADWQDASDEIAEVMQAFAIPDEPRPPRHSPLTLVARPGLCVFGPDEGTWLQAWRYSNHFTNAWSGSLVVVTEHGWVDFMSYAGGHTPALVG